MPHKTKQKIKRIVHFQILSVFAFSIALSSSHLTALASSDSPISPAVTAPSSAVDPNVPRLSIVGASSLNAVVNNPIPVTGLHVSGTSTEPININLGIDSGSLRMAITTGLTFTSDTSGTSLQFSGSIDDLNRALATLTYQSSTAAKTTLTASLGDSGITPSAVYPSAPAHPHRPGITTITITTATLPTVDPSTADMGIYTYAAYNIGYKSASLIGGIYSSTSSITERGFQWGTDSNYGNTVSDTTAKSPFYSTHFTNNSVSIWGMVVDSSGNLFTLGDDDIIRVYDSSGAYLRQFGGTGSGNGQFDHPRGIAIDSTNNIYIADDFNNRIQKFNNNGDYISQFGIAGPYAIYVDHKHSDNIYIVEETGLVTVMDSLGSELFNFNAGVDYTRGVSIDSSGNIYVVGAATNQILKFDSSGNYLSQFGSDHLDSPFGIVIDSNNNTYITNMNTHAMNEFDSSGNYLATFGNGGVGDGVAVDSANDIYLEYDGISKVSDIPSYPVGDYAIDVNLSCGTTYHYRSYGTNSSGTYYGDDQTFTAGTCPAVSTASATNTNSNSSTLNSDVTSTYSDINNLGFNIGTSTSYGTNINVPAKTKTSSNYSLTFGSPGSGDGQFNNPEGVTTDSLGNVYVADSNNQRIEKFDSNGNYLLQWTNPDFSYVYALATDSSNNVYVSDYGDCSPASNIKVFDSNGNFLRQFGSQGNGDGQFACGTSGITIDSNNDIYVYDWMDYRIEKFDQSGDYLTQFGSFGSGDGQFEFSSGLTHDSLNNVFATDIFNYRIQKFDSNGNYLSQFANGLYAALTSYGIAADSYDHIYVGSRSDNGMYVFDGASGVLLTQFISYGDNPGQMNIPEGVAIDSNNNMYVTDYINSNVVKFTPVPFYGLGSYSAAVSGLMCGTNYHYQAFMTNQESTYTGGDQQFGTNSCGGVLPITPPSGLTTSTTPSVEVTTTVPTEGTVTSTAPTSDNGNTEVSNTSLGKTLLKYLPYILLFSGIAALFGYGLYSYNTARVAGTKRRNKVA